MGSEDNGNGNIDEDQIYGYVDLFKSAGDTKPFHIYQLSMTKIKIGREQKCDIRIHNLRISRMQCCIKISGTEENRKVRLQNLTTKATTVFKNQGIPQNQTVDLEDGDRFRLYDTELRFRSYNPNASNGLPESSDTRSPPIIRLVGKDKPDTPEKSSLYKKSPRSEKARPSRSSTRVSDRMNKSAGSSGDKAQRRRKSSDIDMRRAVLQKSFRKSVQGKNFPPDIDENPEVVDLEDEEDVEAEDGDELTQVDPEPMEIDDDEVENPVASESEQSETSVATSVGAKDTSIQCAVNSEEELIQLSSLLQPPAGEDFAEDLIQFHDIDRQMSLLHGEDAVNSLREKDDEPLYLHPESGTSQISSPSSSSQQDSAKDENKRSSLSLEDPSSSSAGRSSKILVQEEVGASSTTNNAENDCSVPSTADTATTGSFCANTSIDVNDVCTQVIDLHETLNLDGKSFYTAADEDERNDVSIDENQALDNTVSDKSDDAEDIFEDAEGDEENGTEKDNVFEESLADDNVDACADTDPSGIAEIGTEAAHQEDNDDDIEIVHEETDEIEADNEENNNGEEEEDEDETEPEVVDIADDSSEDENNGNRYALDSDDGLESELIDLVDTPDIILSVDSPHEPLPNISAEDVESIPVADSPSPINGEELQDGIIIPNGNELDNVGDSSLSKSKNESESDSKISKEPPPDSSDTSINELLVTPCDSVMMDKVVKDSSSTTIVSGHEFEDFDANVVVTNEATVVEPTSANGEVMKTAEVTEAAKNKESKSGRLNEEMVDVLFTDDEAETDDETPGEVQKPDNISKSVLDEVPENVKVKEVSFVDEDLTEAPEKEDEKDETDELSGRQDVQSPTDNLCDEEGEHVLPNELYEKEDESSKKDEPSQKEDETSKPNSLPAIPVETANPEEHCEIEEKEKEKEIANELSDDEDQDAVGKAVELSEKEGEQESEDETSDMEDEMVKPDELSEEGEGDERASGEAEANSAELPKNIPEAEVDGNCKENDSTDSDIEDDLKSVSDFGGGNNKCDPMDPISSHSKVQDNAADDAPSRSPEQQEDLDEQAGATVHSNMEEEGEEMEEDKEDNSNLQRDETSDNKENIVEPVSEETSEESFRAAIGGRSSQLNQRKSSVSKKPSLSDRAFKKNYSVKDCSVVLSRIRIKVDEGDSSDEEAQDGIKQLNDPETILSDLTNDPLGEVSAASVKTGEIAALSSISKPEVEEKEKSISTPQLSDTVLSSTPVKKQKLKKSVVSTSTPTSRRKRSVSTIKTSTPELNDDLELDADVDTHDDANVVSTGSESKVIESPLMSPKRTSSVSKLLEVPKVSPLKFQDSPESLKSPASKDVVGTPVLTAITSTSPPKNTVISPISKPKVDVVGSPSPSPGASASSGARSLNNSGIQIKDCSIVIQRLSIGEDSMIETTPKSQLKNKSLNSSRSSLKATNNVDYTKENESSQETPTTTKSKLKKRRRASSKVEVVDFEEPEREDDEATNKVNTSIVPKNSPTMTPSKAVELDVDPPSDSEKRGPLRKNKRQSQSEKSASEVESEAERQLPIDDDNDQEQLKEDSEAESENKFVKPSIKPTARRGRPRNRKEVSESEESEADKDKFVEPSPRPDHVGNRRGVSESEESEADKNNGKFVKPSPRRGRPGNRREVSESEESDADKFAKPLSRRGRPRNNKDVTESEESDADKFAKPLSRRGRPRNNKDVTESEEAVHPVSFRSRNRRDISESEEAVHPVSVRSRNRRDISESEESEADKPVKPSPARGRPRKLPLVEEVKEVDKLAKPSPARGRPRKNKDKLESENEIETAITPSRSTQPSRTLRRPNKDSVQSESEAESEADKIVIVPDSDGDEEEEDVPAPKRARAEKLNKKKINGNKDHSSQSQEKVIENSKRTRGRGENDQEDETESREKEKQTENKTSHSLKTGKLESPKRKRNARRAEEKIQTEEKIEPSERRTRGQARHEDIEEIVAEDVVGTNKEKAKHVSDVQQHDEIQVISDSESEEEILPKSKRGRFEKDVPEKTKRTKVVESKGTSKSKKKNVQESDEEELPAPVTKSKREAQIADEGRTRTRGRGRNKAVKSVESDDEGQGQENEETEETKQQEAVKLAEVVTKHSSKKKQDANAKPEASTNTVKHQSVDSDTELPSTSRTRVGSKNRTKNNGSRPLQPVVSLVQLEEDIDLEVPAEKLRENANSDDAISSSKTSRKDKDQSRQAKGKHVHPPPASTSTSKSRRNLKNVIEEVEEEQLVDDSESDVEQIDVPASGRSSKAKDEKLPKEDKKSTKTKAISTRSAQPVVLLEYMDSDEEHDKLTKHRNLNRAAAQKSKKMEQKAEESDKDDLPEPELKHPAKRGRTRKAADEAGPSNSQVEQLPKSKRLRRHESTEVIAVNNKEDKQLIESNDGQDETDKAAGTEVEAPIELTSSKVKSKRGRPQAVEVEEAATTKEVVKPNSDSKEEKETEAATKSRRGKEKVKNVDKVANLTKAQRQKEVAEEVHVDEASDENEKNAETEQIKVSRKKTTKTASASSSKAKSTTKPAARGRHAKVVEEEVEESDKDEEQRNEQEPEPKPEPEPPKVAKRGLKRTKDVNKNRAEAVDRATDNEATVRNPSKKKTVVKSTSSKRETSSEEDISNKSKTQKVQIVQKAPKDRVVLQLPETNDDDVIELSSDDETAAPVSPVAKRLRVAPKVSTPVQSKKSSRSVKSKRTRK